MSSSTNPHKPGVGGDMLHRGINELIDLQKKSTLPTSHVCEAEHKNTYYVMKQSSSQNNMMSKFVARASRMGIEDMPKPLHALQIYMFTHLPKEKQKTKTKCATSQLLAIPMYRVHLV